MNVITSGEHDALVKASFIKGKVGATMPKFDWYQASVLPIAHLEATETEFVDNLIESACLAFPEYDFQEVRGIAQYDNCLAFGPAYSTDQAFQVNFGGNNDAPPNVKATGSNATEVAEWLRRDYPVHRVTRVDSACDLWGEGLADQIFEDMDRVHASTRRLKRGDHGFNSPENGRTYYLGAPSSRLRVRCYEKGLEQGLGSFAVHGTWVRAEAQCRPPKVDDGLAAARMSALDIWGMSQWSSSLFWAIMQREPEPYEWTRRVKPTTSDSLKLLYHQRRRLLSTVGREEAHKLLDEMYDCDFKVEPVEFVSPDGEVVPFQAELF